MSSDSDGVKMKIDGRVETYDGDKVFGWCWDRDKPDVQTPIEILSSNGDVVSGIANIFRDDLLAVGIGDGCHGFAIGVPKSWAVLDIGKLRVRCKLASNQYDDVFLATLPLAEPLNSGQASKRVVFHLGIPKTGSSVLQIFLAKNRERLLEQGFDYPQTGEFDMAVGGEISSGNGAYLARCLLPNENHEKITGMHADAEITKVLDAIRSSSASTVILSSELFVFADPNLISDFLRTLRDFGVRPTVMYYIRRQDQFLTSSYIQMVKRHGYSGSPDEYAAREMSNIRYLKFYSYYREQCQLFGSDHVIVRIFESPQATADELYLSFLAALQIQPSGFLLDIAPSNPSVYGPDLELMRALNKFRPRNKFSDMIIKNSQMRAASMVGTAPSLLNAETIKNIVAYFEEENLHFARKYFNQDALFPSIRRSSEGTAPSDADDVVDLCTASDLVNFLGAIVVRLDERLAGLEARMTIGDTDEKTVG